MLILCPECNLQVSDKALACPHCGLPMKSDVKIRRKSKKKRRRLPNGFGSITELKNRNLRNPFYARVCVGKTETGRPILKSLKPVAYFATYNDAYAALVEYNKDPYELQNDMLMRDLYSQWSQEYFEKITGPASRSVASAWSYCCSIYNVPVRSIRARHIKKCIDEAYVIEKYGSNKGLKKNASPGTKARIKSIMNLMLDYAVEYEIVSTNYARTFNISDDITQAKESNRKSHMPFEQEELEILWRNDENQYVDLILIQCYAGWRPQELCSLKTSDVDWEHEYIRGGSKTESGRNRIVPIHPKTRELIKEKYNEAVANGYEYLFTINGKKLTYDKYSYRFENIIKELGLDPNHRPHDGRNTFITMAKKYKVDEFAIKRIVGHSISYDVTESVYTSRTPEWLLEEIKKIP